MKNYIAGILLSLMAACGPAEEAEMSQLSVGLNTSYERIFGWGVIGPKSTISSTGGPGPADKNMSIECYTQQLPPGIDYSCEAPENGTIQMNITNTNDYTVNVGNRWAGASF